jgi:hypothetical protein
MCKTVIFENFYVLIIFDPSISKTITNRQKILNFFDKMKFKSCVVNTCGSTNVLLVPFVKSWVNFTRSKEWAEFCFCFDFERISKSQP